jgi:Response regulator containing a CheY-like receiver domain and an HTH DNA-binding domain
MPIIDGIAVTKILSQEYPTIFILAVSMYDQRADVMEMVQAGARGYVTKDVEKKELITAIHTLMKGELYFSKKLPFDIKDWLEAESDTNEKNLTKREKEILQLLVKGRTSLEMADQLKISRYTIDTHRKNIHKKLGIKTNTGLVKYGITVLNL